MSDDEDDNPNKRGKWYQEEPPKGPTASTGSLIKGQMVMASSWQVGTVEQTEQPNYLAEEHAVQPYMAAQQRTKKFVHEHDLRSRPQALLWLSKVYGILAGMYEYQV
eukprot:1160625-Pelagomonas_calceolata.AAC.1